MTTGIARTNVKTNEEPLVITKSAEGYKVYSVNTPTRSYQVTGTASEPLCTCPEFQLNHRNDSEWRCKHIMAVFQRDSGSAANAPASDSAAGFPEVANGHGYMLLKRSVSPDGRIDSLSVEFSCPTNGNERGELVMMAAEVLEIQRDIVSAFMNGRRGDDGEPPQPPPAPTANGHPVPATLVGMAGMNSRWGRRLYLMFEVDGRTVKLFGTQQELAAAIMSAGFPDRANQIREGDRLSLPCQVITQPARDSRYTDIVRVLPDAAGPNRRGYR